MRDGQIEAAIRKIAWLTLLLNVGLGYCGEPPSDQTCKEGRGKWDKQRAVILANKLIDKGLPVDVKWPTGKLGLDDDCKEASSGLDPCVDATIALNYYYVDKTKNEKQWIVISDLTRAAKCDGKKCVCAEEGAVVTKAGGIKICAKKLGKDDKECIHNVECAGKNCIFNPRELEKASGCGDIEDMRRFCSGAGGVLPTMIIVLLSTVSISSFTVFK